MEGGMEGLGWMAGRRAGWRGAGMWIKGWMVGFARLEGWMEGFEEGWWTEGWMEGGLERMEGWVF